MTDRPEASMQLEGRFWLDRAGRPFLGPGRVALLEHIDACRSIAEAARAMGMGYKTAWDLVDAMNRLAEQPLVVRLKGGRQGGGTELTAYGRSVVATFRALERDYTVMLDVLGARYPDIGPLAAHPRAPRLRTSARNQWPGHVAGIEQHAPGALVTVDIGTDAPVLAALSSAAVEELGLAPGAEVWALVKATAVGIGVVAGWGSGPANRLHGSVAQLHADPAGGRAELTLALAHGRQVHAIVGAATIAALGVQTGVAAYAQFEPAAVILAVGD